MKTTRYTTRTRSAAPRVDGSALGLRAAMTLLAVLALAVGFATARAQAPDAEGVPDGWSGYENQPYRVNIWQDRGEDEVYQRGEAVRIHFETNNNAYVVVYRIDTEGRVEILWPRSRFDDGFVFGHHTYNLPTPGAERIRAGDEEGVEYVQALVSAYPFDLRALDVDFHHEQGGQEHAYYVAGDPFLAMNDLNYAVTGLDDPADYVVSNYVSYYVHRQVDHPRYLCLQCHDDDAHYRPYADVCTVEIHHDYSWDNGWFDRYHYYPAYYYPAYYYVDPWTGRPWINYWYRPWYVWPSWNRSPWGFDCYVWNYSPYYQGDVWVRYKQGDRRYRPIVKGHSYADAGADRDYNHPGALVKTPRPTRDMVDSMDDRVAMRKDRDSTVSRGGAAPTRGQFKDAGRTARTTTEFTREDRPVRAPGLRLPGTVDRGTGGTGGGVAPEGRAVRGRSSDERGTVTPTARPDGRRDQTPTRVSPGTKPSTGGGESRAVRPVAPNTQGERIWRGGSREQKRDTRTVKPRSDSSTSSSRRQVQPKSNSSDTPTRRAPVTKSSGRKSKTSQKSPAVKPSRSKSSGGSSGSSVKSRSSGGSAGSGAKSSGRTSGSHSSGSSGSGSRGSGRSSSSRGRG